MRGPGQYSLISRSAASGTAVHRESAWLSSQTRTGSSTFRGRPFTRKSRSAAPVWKGSAAKPVDRVGRQRDYVAAG